MEKIICANKADVYLSDHLEFSTSSSCEMDLVVSGGGGDHLYPINDTSKKNELFAESVHGFTKLTLNEAQIFMNTTVIAMNYYLLTKGLKTKIYKHRNNDTLFSLL